MGVFKYLNLMFRPCTQSWGRGRPSGGRMFCSRGAPRSVRDAESLFSPSQIRPHPLCHRRGGRPGGGSRRRTPYGVRVELLLEVEGPERRTAAKGEAGTPGGILSLAIRGSLCSGGSVWATGRCLPGKAASLAVPTASCRAADPPPPPRTATEKFGGFRFLAKKRHGWEA